MAVSVLKPKYDINVRFARSLGVARITFLRGNKRNGSYVFCSSEAMEAGRVEIVNKWLRRNHSLAVRVKKVGAVKTKILTRFRKTGYKLSERLAA